MRTHIQKSFQVKYTRVYLSVRTMAGTYDPWVNVSLLVVASDLGQYSRSIDSNDFDIGFSEESNIRISFSNEDALFTEGFGYFENRMIDRSRIRIVAGFVDTEDLRPEFEVTFEGIIDDQATALDAKRETATFTVLSYSSVIQRLRTDPGAVSNGQSFQVALFNLLSRSEVSQLLTVDLENLNPKVNLTIQNASWFDGRPLKDSINRLLLASNSVMKITRDHELVITGRQQSPTVRFQFFGKGASRPANIEGISNFHSGLRRVITSVTVNGITMDAPDELITWYGLRAKALDIGFINNEPLAREIAEDVLDEFAYPKRELELTTDFLANEVDLLDMVTIDNEGSIQDEAPAVYGSAIYGQSAYVQRQGGVRIRPIEGYKVLGITHDYRRYSTTLKLRAVGQREFDSNAGYANPIYGQAIYGLSRYAVLT